MNRRRKYEFYVKPWMHKKRAKEVNRYKAMEKTVTDLKHYVKFVNEAKKLMK